MAGNKVQIQNLATPPVDQQVLETQPTSRFGESWKRWFLAVQQKINIINGRLASLAGSISTTTAGTYGSSTEIPVVTVDSNGIVTTISQVSPAASGGNPLIVTNNTATTYTVPLTAAPASSSNIGWIASSVGSANSVQIDIHANQAFPIGTHLYVSEEGTGQTTIKALAGVTFKGPTISAVPKGVGEAVQIAIDTWHIFGNLAYQIYASYASVILGDTPIAYWHLGEVSGTTATDSSGNGYTGTYTGTYTQGQTSILPGGYGKSLLLAGAGYIITPSSAPLAGISAPISLEAWLYFTTMPTTNEVIIELCYSGPQLAISSTTTGRLTFGYSGVVNGTESSGTISATTKTHVVVTCDGSGNLIYYLQGAAAGTGTVSLHSGTGVGNIGRYGNGGSFLLTGSIQEVAVYNYVLTPTQVSNHYAAG